MRHRDIKFLGVRFSDDESLPPTFADVVVDVLAIDYFAVCRDSHIDAKRPLLELHLKSGARVYIVDIPLEHFGSIRRHAAAIDMSASRFTDN